MTDQLWDEAAFWALGICPFCGGPGKMERHPAPADLQRARYVCQFCAAVWRNPAALHDFGACHRCGRDQGPLNPDDPSPDTCPRCTAQLAEMIANRMPALFEEYQSPDLVGAYVIEWLIDEAHVRPLWAEAYQRAMRG
jgi:hypothetical protein